jgi:hypothetical protein
MSKWHVYKAYNSNYTSDIVYASAMMSIVLHDKIQMKNSQLFHRILLLSNCQDSLHALMLAKVLTTW